MAERSKEDHEMLAACEDCLRPYGHEHGFPDLVISYDAWRQISTHGDESGLLCPSCICKRLHDKGISTTGAFMSGPIQSVSYEMNGVLRQLENIELALEGRMNRWGVALQQRIIDADDPVVIAVRVAKRAAEDEPETPCPHGRVIACADCAQTGED